MEKYVLFEMKREKIKPHVYRTVSCLCENPPEEINEASSEAFSKSIVAGYIRNTDLNTGNVTLRYKYFKEKASIPVEVRYAAHQLTSKGFEPRKREIGFLEKRLFKEEKYSPRQKKFMELESESYESR